VLHVTFKLLWTSMTDPSVIGLISYYIVLFYCYIVSVVTIISVIVYVKYQRCRRVSVMSVMYSHLGTLGVTQWCTLTWALWVHFLPRPMWVIWWHQEGRLSSQNYFNASVKVRLASWHSWSTGQCGIGNSSWTWLNVWWPQLFKQKTASNSSSSSNRASACP